MYEGVGQYNIPAINPINDINICKWIGFNCARTHKGRANTTGVQFFIDDYQFERVWNDPERYAEFLKPFEAVLSPDFSLYTDFPKAIQIYNHYRKHWCAKFWQESGVKVIPTIAWSDKESYEWCFDGEPEGGIVAVSNVGCMNNKEARRAFMDGYNEMLIRLHPSKVLMFGHIFDDYKGNVEYIKYSYWKGN